MFVCNHLELFRDQNDAVKMRNTFWLGKFAVKFVVLGLWPGKNDEEKIEIRNAGTTAAAGGASDQAL